MGTEHSRSVSIERPVQGQRVEQQRAGNSHVDEVAGMEIDQRNLLRLTEFAVTQVVEDALLQAVEESFVGSAEGLVVAHVEGRRGGRAFADGDVLVSGAHQPHESAHHGQLGGGFGQGRDQIGLEQDALLAARDRGHAAKKLDGLLRRRHRCCRCGFGRR